MMRLRWASALVGMPLYVGLCLWGRVPFTLAVLAVAALGLAEMMRAYREQGIRPNVALAALGLLGPAIGLLPDGKGPFSSWQLLDGWTASRLLSAVVPVVVFVALAWEVLRAARTGEIHPGRNIAYGLLCGLYIALFGGLSWLRDSTDRSPGRFPALDAGAALILQVTFCVWASDSFALFVGRACGRRKLAPLLSPHKTVEGAVGGLVVGLLVGALFGGLLLGSAGIGLLIGAIAGMFGQVGDLFESALKREAGIKDFGGILPGHGGVLDRFDSLLFVAPLVALLLLILGRLEFRF